MSEHPDFHPEDPQENKSATNTILLWCTLGLLGFVGWGTFNNSVTLAEMKGAAMPRSEVEASIASVRASQQADELKIQGLEIEIVRLGRVPGNQAP